MRPSVPRQVISSCRLRLTPAALSRPEATGGPFKLAHLAVCDLLWLGPVDQFVDINRPGREEDSRFLQARSAQRTGREVRRCDDATASLGPVDLHVQTLCEPDVGACVHDSPKRRCACRAGCGAADQTESLRLWEVGRSMLAHVGDDRNTPFAVLRLSQDALDLGVYGGGRVEDGGLHRSAPRSLGRSDAWRCFFAAEKPAVS